LIIRATERNPHGISKQGRTKVGVIGPTDSSGQSGFTDTRRQIWARYEKRKWRGRGLARSSRMREVWWMWVYPAYVIATVTLWCFRAAALISFVLLRSLSDGPNNFRNFTI